LSESELIYQIMRELGKYGAVYRCNAGAIKLSNGRYFRALPEGFADVMFFRNDGVACFIECKVNNNKLSDKQGRFLAKMRGLNCRAGVSRSIAEALEICGIDNKTIKEL